MSLRCFVGLEPTPPLVCGLEGVMDVLRTTDRGWAQEKWVLPNNLHVTTCFIGDVEASRIDALCDALRYAVAPCRSFDLSPGVVVARPQAARARMVWASMADSSDGAAHLARAVTHAALPFGVSDQDRRYAAHVTLCRARHDRAISTAALEAASSQLRALDACMSVSSATLFSSRLTTRGPIYERLAVMRMGGSDGSTFDP